MKINFFNSFLFCSLLLICSCSHAYAKKPLTEQQALDILIAQIQKDKRYDTWTNISCLSFLTEAETTNNFDFSIREKHGDECPGDPDTAPLVDSFRVNRITNNIQLIHR